MKLCLLFLTNFLSASLVYSQNLPQDSRECGRYVSGIELSNNNPNLVKYENGFFVEVPKKYENPSGEKIKIYAYFAEKYDSSKPTYVFFLGGPGQNSHQSMSFKFNFFKTLGYNFLLMDQRGISFSRFDKVDDALNTENYSSEYTAKDMLSVVDSLGLKKVSVYGASYGTIPATIFASMFPERTTSVVLEGVVYDGDKTIYQDLHRVKILQRYYDSLSENIKVKIETLINEKQLNEYELPGTLMAILMMYGEDMLPFYTKVLNRALIETEFKSRADLVKAWGDVSNETFPAKKSYSMVPPKLSNDICFKIEDSSDVNQILMIKEFGASELTSFTTFTLKNRKIEPLMHSGYVKSDTYKNWPNSKVYYSANNYPVKTPLFYLQGTYDGATPATGAILHFKNTPQVDSQLFLFKGSPHMPTGKIINDMNDLETEWKPLQGFFKSLLDGNGLSCDEVNLLNKTYLTAKLSSAGKNGLKNCKYIK